MNLSQNVLLCEYSPMRKFHPYAAAAAQQGKKIYHLNGPGGGRGTSARCKERIRNEA